MTEICFKKFQSEFGEFIIVWKEIQSQTLIQRIFLGSDFLTAEQKTTETFGILTEKANQNIDSVGKQIQTFLTGLDSTFNLGLLDFSACSPIQKEVLLAEYKIPRGWVSTYKRIAEHLGIKNGARVVGNSLARNPFPIFIPCHRAIRSDGTLGGYQGGLQMKQRLLEMEGVPFSKKGKVLTTNFHY